MSDGLPLHLLARIIKPTPEHCAIKRTVTSRVISTASPIMWSAKTGRDRHVRRVVDGGGYRTFIPIRSRYAKVS